MGHLGLTPQSVHHFGGFRAQGKTAVAAKRLYEDAYSLQEAGCFSLVLEAIPGQLANLVSSRLEIPTIGIGAGFGCDGQVLVTHDILGLYDRFTPKFVKQYADLHAQIGAALAAYKSDVNSRAFPGAEHTIEMPDDEWRAFLNQIDD
jgi:3-methyl-2-oxobutanoate hydroxymethyltransferase